LFILISCVIIIYKIEILKLKCHPELVEGFIAEIWFDRLTMTTKNPILKQINYYDQLNEN